MAQFIQINAGSVEAIAELNSTGVAKAIWEALPITAESSLWGDEVYFPIPVYTELEGGKSVVNIGDLGYWPTRNAFCIFFGPTPVSRGDEIRAASAVNIIGKVSGDPKAFLKVKDGAKITLEKA